MFQVKWQGYPAQPPYDEGGRRTPIENNEDFDVQPRDFNYTEMVLEMCTHCTSSFPDIVATPNKGNLW